jgi:hypothetical protein
MVEEEEDSDDNQDDGARDDQDQKFTLPNNEPTYNVNTACLRQYDGEEHSLVKDYIGEEGGKECHCSRKTNDIEISKEREKQPTHHKETSVLDVDYKGDVTKLIDGAYKGNVFKLAIKDTDDEPQEEHDDQDRDKLFEDVTKVLAPRQRAMEDHRTSKEGVIAPLDSLYPTMRALSDGEKQQTHHRMPAMHESTYQEGVKDETYRENRSCAKKMMMMALHHTGDRKTHTTSPAMTTRTCTKTSKEGHKKIKMIAFAMEGEEGHN